MELIQIDGAGKLFVSPEIDDWGPIHDNRIHAIIDLDGDIDMDVPTAPNHVLYIYFPIYDEDLPDLIKLHSVAKMAAELIRLNRPVLAHCRMGLNRSPLVAGVTLTYLGFSGPDALKILQERRPGALYNEQFAEYLASLPSNPNHPLDKSD
ncbi:MAG TPA: dual specificity protein phosphatase family protein [Blastocatellia bacterium]|nr:dual specificity protein phosphatase family protein [Blastocatellia bacterium]